MPVPVPGRSLVGLLVLVGAVAAVSVVSNAPALAQGPGPAPDALDARILAAARLPRVANEARTAGVAESDLGAALAACKSHRLDAGEAAPALAAATVAAGTSPETARVAAILDAQLSLGLRGQALVEALEGLDAAPAPAPDPDPDPADPADPADDADDDANDDTDDDAKSKHAEHSKAKHGKAKHGKAKHGEPKKSKSKHDEHDKHDKHDEHEPKLGAPGKHGKGHRGEDPREREGKGKR